MAADELGSLLARLHNLEDLERTLSKLQRFVESASVGSNVVWDEVCQRLELLAKNAADWKARYGALRAVNVVLSKAPPIPTLTQFEDSLANIVLGVLQDCEVRVRMSAFNCIESLARRRGVSFWNFMEPFIVSNITSNLTLVEPSGEDLINDIPAHPQQLPLWHEPPAWRPLECGFIALQHIIRGIQSPILPALLSHTALITVLIDATHHPNRHVREISQFSLAAIISVICDCATREKFSQLALPPLAAGLGDPWPIVRFAASVGVRELFTCCSASLKKFTSSRSPTASAPTTASISPSPMSTPSEKPAFERLVFPALLPRMCMNRYDLSERVRMYSQDTWRLVVGPTRGPTLVAQYLDRFIEIYEFHARRREHAAGRVTACECIGELASKIDSGAILPHVERLLGILADCMGDSQCANATWRERLHEVACVASLKFVGNYPDQSRATLDKLLPCWTALLCEDDHTVREIGAIALRTTAAALDFDKVVRYIQDAVLPHCVGHSAAQGSIRLLTAELATLRPELEAQQRALEQCLEALRAQFKK